MVRKILLITPPFTQLNTPYPASPCLKGFLKMHGFDVRQADLGIELINDLFSYDGFERLFSFVKKNKVQLSENALRILHNEAAYLGTVERVMNFLHYKDDTLARLLCRDDFLPRASRFEHLPDLEWAFGTVGVNDQARFLATLYVEDVGDLIKEAVTPSFGFSKYADKLAMSAHSFSAIDQALQQPENIIEIRLLALLKDHMERYRPQVVGMTIPFPGNLFGGLKCGRYIKAHYPDVKIILGGGFANTELRELSEPAVFDYVDFITLDDGERPFLNILAYLSGEKNRENLKRTYLKIDGIVQYIDDGGERDFAHAETGCPDYSDLPLDNYLSLIDLANPMHRLWSDGRWNKLTIAHGCYWHKCSFCDTSLDYINRFDGAPASVTVDRIVELIGQTGRTGFHFVDEAAPPQALKELALELLRRKIVISWWANIRFEAAFTVDLCRLLAASGCIAATGGLETASDRLLALMNKGVTVRQAAIACRNFSRAGILVHAYLMYGFPTETEQETVDSLEVVRRFFEEGLVQSAFWHQFIATVHSDVGKNPETYQCRILDAPAGGFAKNDLVHEDPAGCDHHAFSAGLNKAVYNFMHGIGTDFSIHEWFDFPVPAASVKRNHVLNAINERPRLDKERWNSRVLWLENLPEYVHADSTKKEKPGHLIFYTKTESFSLSTTPELGTWLLSVVRRCSFENPDLPTLGRLKQDYEKRFSSDFESFLKSKEWKTLRKKGLLLI